MSARSQQTDDDPAQHRRLPDYISEIYHKNYYSFFLQINQLKVLLSREPKVFASLANEFAPGKRPVRLRGRVCESAQADFALFQPAVDED